MSKETLSKVASLYIILLVIISFFQVFIDGGSIDGVFDFIYTIILGIFLTFLYAIGSTLIAIVVYFLYWVYKKGTS